MENLFVKHQIYNVSDLQKHYEKIKGEDGHWFSPGAMSFFNSKLDTQVYHDRDLFYFVSSERPDNVRKYTIRSYDPTTAEIDNVGGFQAYKTQTAAKSAIKQFKGIRY